MTSSPPPPPQHNTSEQPTTTTTTALDPAIDLWLAQQHLLPEETPAMSASAASSDGAAAASVTAGVNTWFPEIPRILPHEKVFPIQIGSELFRLSGASISSDAPSYFSQFFERQLANVEEHGGSIRTLYIDRDPETFRDIAKHLQGYHLSPRDGPHFVRLFADAQFYIPKLISQLFESEIYISIGSQHFQINRDLLETPGNSPNYFTLGFAVFFSNPKEVFPGLSRDGLLRPPSILPPSVPHRSAEVFSEILHLLRGYPVHIRNEEHRQQLIRDCKYFHLKGLEQRLIAHDISFNPRRQKHEILIRIGDIKPSGVSFVPDTGGSSSGQRQSGWINYARPYIDEAPRELIIEIAGESTKIDPCTSRAKFSGITNQRVSALLQVITNKLGLPISQEWPMGLKMIDQMNGAQASVSSSPANTPLSDDKVKVRLGPECFITLDGEEYWDRDGIMVLPVDENPDAGSDAGGDGSAMWAQQLSRPPSTTSFPQQQQQQQRKRLKRKRSAEEVAAGGEWMVKRGQWRLRIQPNSSTGGSGLEIVLVGVKVEAFSGEYGRNGNRAFLS